MAVGLPAKATLDTAIFFTEYKSIIIHESYVGNRQDAIGAVEIVASGAVKCHYETRKMAEKYIDRFC
jgi:alcohol dehydrogenase, propanol-preferring